MSEKILILKTPPYAKIFEEMDKEPQKSTTYVNKCIRCGFKSTSIKKYDECPVCKILRHATTLWMSESEIKHTFSVEPSPFKIEGEINIRKKVIQHYQEILLKFAECAIELRFVEPEFIRQAHQAALILDMFEDKLCYCKNLNMDGEWISIDEAGLIVYPFSSIYLDKQYNQSQLLCKKTVETLINEKGDEWFIISD